MEYTHILVPINYFDGDIDNERLANKILDAHKLDLSDNFIMDKMINAPIKSLSNYTSGYAEGYAQAIKDILNK